MIFSWPEMSSLVFFFEAFALFDAMFTQLLETVVNFVLGIDEFWGIR